MALEDYVSKVTTTHSYVDEVNAGTSPSVEQAGTYEIDGDFTTWHGIDWSRGGANGNCTVSGEHTFATAIDLSRVMYRLWAHAEADVNLGCSVLKYVQYCVASVWTDVPNSRSTTDGDSGTVTYDFATPIENVTAVKAYVYSSGTTDDEGGAKGHSKVYEIQAYAIIKKSYSGVIQ